MVPGDSGTLLYMFHRVVGTCAAGYLGILSTLDSLFLAMLSAGKQASPGPDLGKAYTEPALSTTCHFQVILSPSSWQAWLVDHL